MPPIRGVLLDIDGVLHVSMQPLPGAAETLFWLDQEGYSTYCVSNTTTMSRETLAQSLQRIGLPVSEQRIITAPVAAARYLRQHFAGKRCWLLTKGDTAKDFAGIELVDTHADVVIIGGAEELLTYETMNAAFRMLMDGATLFALHRNLYWRTKDGLQLDSGPYVKALEVASGKEAIVFGKPAATFFKQALDTIDCAANETIMVGDDIENDIGGAQRMGMRGIFVCTGKHKADSPLLARIQPEAILPALADLSHWLASNNA
ncbi:haloacid dehalogenase [Dictyobacter alpinus]|uniref:Haloacid dehalogenase-like hydrolase domain-containing protein 2 n=1 Tax=Dictyobacter alpinus TaxID=2014873 RepID=A0A402AZK2_9CHLR|nr:TIGR01458 family HAD-type hydrolase [Dictyobacter alpinus]GCE24559.1 haloacid dehalogenase [Dictyobacter alpinus]